MTFVDDALPVARPVRSGIAAVKGRNSEDEGGAAFRKAFADLGRPHDATGKVQAKAADTPEAADVETNVASETAGEVRTETLDVPLDDQPEKPTANAKTQAERPIATAQGRQDKAAPAVTQTSYASLQTVSDHSSPSASLTKMPADGVRPSASAMLSASLALKAVTTDAATDNVAQAPTLAQTPTPAQTPAPAKTQEAPRLPSKTAQANVAADLPGPVKTKDSPARASDASARTTSKPETFAKATSDAVASAAVRQDAVPTLSAKAEDIGKAASTTVQEPQAAVGSAEQKPDLPDTDVPVKADPATRVATSSRAGIEPVKSAVPATSGSAKPVTANTPSNVPVFEPPHEMEAAVGVPANTAGAGPADIAESATKTTTTRPVATVPTKSVSTGITPSAPTATATAPVAEAVPDMVSSSPDRANLISNTVPAPAAETVTEPEKAIVRPKALYAEAMSQTRQVVADATDEDESVLTEVAAEPAGQSDIRDLLAILGPRQTTSVVQETPAKGLDRPADSKGLTEKLAANLPASQVAQSAVSTSETDMTPIRNDGADQVFRFARADGTSGTSSARVDAEPARTVSATDQAAAKAETVTVLDARRYLGIAPTPSAQLPMTANSQSVATAIAGNADATQLNASLSAGQPGAAGKVVNTLKIQMHPIDLGMVTATLRLKDDELQIDLRVQSGEAYRQLTDDQDAMIQSLRAQGFQVDQVNVVFTPSDSGGDASQQPQGNQQQASQNGRDAQGGFASSSNGEQRDSGSGQRRADDRRIGNDTTRETSPASQPGLSDDIYL